MKIRLLAGLLIAAGAACGGDSAFDQIVHAIESHYGVRRMHIPFLGLASFVVDVTRPEGASGLKLAIFEDLKSSGHEWAERDRFMQSLDDTGLHPFVRVHNRRDGEATYIFMSPDSRRARILVASFERDEATVVEVKADLDTVFRHLDEPDRIGKSSK
ncbi:MAG TPA: hypothetical protein VMI94_13475 [Bryobacteraceae bacterium]|nr:hypothetical protein [Bryobacteraceae bacterium]